MEGVERLNYGIERVEDSESEVSLVIKQTVDQGINDNGVLSFRFPPDPVRFTELNSAYIKVQLKVESKTGQPKTLKEEDTVFLDQAGINSLFSSCDVRIDGKLVSSMTAYPYTSRLATLLGSSGGMREVVWRDLSGTWASSWTDSDLSKVPADMANLWYTPIQLLKGSKSVSLYSRIYSDILTSCRQYLPPGANLSIDFKRSPDNFALCKINREGGPYRVVIESASVYLKRIRFNPSITSTVESRIKSGANLTFNRLDTRIMSIPKNNKVWRWLDCLNGEALPNRLYVGFVDQNSLYGDICHMSTYFECLNLASLNIKLNGRDLLVDPIKVKYGRGATGQVEPNLSDAQEGYLSLVSVMDQISNQMAPSRVSYVDYTGGATIYAFELGKCGEKSGETGLLDLELTFGEGGSEKNGCVMVFTEKTETVHIRPFHPST